MHVGICGVTGTGKSSLAKVMCAEYHAAGHGCLVFDPIYDGGWQADFVTADKKQFVEAYFNSENCRVFIDECSELDRHKDKAFNYMATRGRHYGHVNFFIAQRWKMMPRNVRSQCSKVFSFRQADEDAKELAKDIGNKDLSGVVSLERGQYMFASAFESHIDRLF